LIVPLPGHQAFASRLALRLGAELAPGVAHRPPPAVPVRGREVVLVSSLQRSERQLLPLLMLARRTRHQGATGLFLVTPHLVLPEGDGAAGALRQTLGRHFDGIVSVQGGDARMLLPPWGVAAAGPALGREIAARCPQPLLVAVGGVMRWTETIAVELQAPLLSAGGFATAAAGHCHELLDDSDPVLLADAVGDGLAILRLARELRRRGTAPPLVAVIHADFAPGAVARLAPPEVDGVISTNTVLHPSNRVDVSEAVADAIWRLWSSTLSPIRSTGLAVAAAR